MPSPESVVIQLGPVRTRVISDLLLEDRRETCSLSITLDPDGTLHCLVGDEYGDGGSTVTFAPLTLDPERYTGSPTEQISQLMQGRTLPPEVSLEAVVNHVGRVVSEGETVLQAAHCADERNLLVVTDTRLIPVDLFQSYPPPTGFGLPIAQVWRVECGRRSVTVRWRDTESEPFTFEMWSDYGGESIYRAIKDAVDHLGSVAPIAPVNDSYLVYPIPDGMHEAPRYQP